MSVNIDVAPLPARVRPPRPWDPPTTKVGRKRERLAWMLVLPSLLVGGEGTLAVVTAAPLVGVLALQGDVREHELEALGDALAHELVLAVERLALEPRLHEVGNDHHVARGEGVPVRAGLAERLVLGRVPEVLGLHPVGHGDARDAVALGDGVLLGHGSPDQDIESRWQYAMVTSR